MRLDEAEKYGRRPIIRLLIKLLDMVRNLTGEENHEKNC